MIYQLCLSGLNDGCRLQHHEEAHTKNPKVTAMRDMLSLGKVLPKENKKNTGAANLNSHNPRQIKAENSPG